MNTHDATNSEPDSTPGGAQLVGLLFLLAGLAVNLRSVGALGADDGLIEGSAQRLVVMAFQAVLFASGAWLFLRGGRVSSGLRGALGLVGLGLIAIGGWGWTHPVTPDASAQAGPGRILSFSELCEWLSEKDPYVGRGRLEEYEQALVQARKDPSDTGTLGDALERAGELYLRFGRNAEAVALLEESLQIARSSGRGLDVQQRVLRTLGVSFMRIGEADHCIAMHNPESCLFPVQGGGVWANPEGAIRAGEIFLEYLRNDPTNLDVRWLLNVAHQVAGTHPEGVAPEFLIPLSTFDSEVPVAAFREIAGALGVDSFNLAGGVIMDDFDNDGLLDLFTTTLSYCESVNYYHNSGGGKFEDWTERAGLSDQLGGINCVQADIDSDGLLDVLILRGAWQGKRFGRQRNSLLRQRPDGTFADVTLVAGLGDVAYPTQVGAFGDYDLDGDIDLFIGNEYAPCQLFRNDGRGRFEDMAAEAGVAGLSNCAVKGASWGDYDNDGDQDLYVSNYGKPNFLYRNDGAGVFTEVAAALGVDAAEDSLARRPGDDQAREPGRTSILSKDFTREKGRDKTFVSWFWDVDNDGWLDIYVGGFGGSLTDVAGSYMDQPVPVRSHLRLYRNDGKGGFVNVSTEMGVDDVLLPMGANYGDFDSDGFQDFYLGTGRPGFEYLVPNVLYKNVGGKRFEDVTAAARVGHLQKGHGIAFGDLDNDGDLDIFAQMGGFYPADGFRDALFENPGNENHWLTVALLGVESNRFGIGARLKAVLETPAGTREVYALCGSGASFGASSLQVELGLGDAIRVVRLEVTWPNGAVQVLEQVPLDRFVRVTEGAGQIELLERPVIALGS